MITVIQCECIKLSSLELISFRDASATTMFVVGSTFGEAIIPVGIGLAMRFTGPQALMYCTLTIVILMVGIYVAAHHLLVRSGQTQGRGRCADVNTEHSEEVNAMHLHDREVGVWVATREKEGNRPESLSNGKSLFIA